MTVCMLNQPDSKRQKTTVVVTTEEKEDVHDLMLPYYVSLFPAKALFEWLNYGYFDDDDKKPSRKPFRSFQRRKGFMSRAYAARGHRSH